MNEEEESKLLSEIFKINISELFLEFSPESKLEKEIGENDEEFLKTTCIVCDAEKQSKLPTLYFNNASCRFQCFHCGKMGGIVHLAYISKDGEFIEYLLNKIGYKADAKNIEKYKNFLEERLGDEMYMDFMDKTFLTGKYLAEDDNWYE